MIDVATLTVADIARKAKIDPGILRQWIARKALELVEGKDRATNMPTRLITPRTAYIAAITARMTEHGIPVSKAADAARIVMKNWELTQNEVFLVLYSSPTDEKHKRITIAHPILGRAKLADLMLTQGTTVRTIVNVSSVVAEFDGSE